MHALQILLRLRYRRLAVRVVAGTILLISCGLAVTIWAAAGVPLTRTSLDHPEPQAGANFGSVFGIGDLNGDGVNEFVVSAINQDVGANIGQGRAYVFNGVDRSLLFTLDTPIPLPAAAFGDAVANAGDVDHDGTPDLIIGAPNFTSDSTPSPGQAFVFSGRTAALLLVLDDPDPPSEHVSTNFGTAVEGVGDVDGDGYPDLLVGEGGFAGQAFLFSGIDGSLLRKFDNPLPAVVSQFGIAVAALGDVNSNGVPDMAIGSGGRVFVFDGNGGLIRTHANPSPGFFDTFGPTIAPLGDINHDGITDLVAGDFAGAPNFAGQVFLFSGADARLLKRFVGPGPHNEFDFFGGSLAGPGDLNGDGIPDLLIGADSKDVGANVDQGRVYVYLSSH